MSRSPAKRGRASQIPLFINKLYQMIENATNKQTIDWTTTGDSFNIKNISRFTEEVLPSYFKHRNFASFIRQLNMYGFRKIRHSDGQNVYANQNFKIGGKHLLKNICRKIKEERDDQLEVYRGDNQNGNRPTLITRQIVELKTNQKNLEEMCRHFMQQNQRLLEQNQRIIKKMQDDQKEKEQKLQQLLVYLLTQKDTKSLIGPNSNQQRLSITNYQTKPSQLKIEQTPLESIGRAIDSNEQLHKLKNLFQDIVFKKDKKRDNNFTIMPHQTSEQGSIRDDNSMVGEQISSQMNLNNDMKEQNFPDVKMEDDDKSFLSINDFLNADDLSNNFNFQP